MARWKGEIIGCVPAKMMESRLEITVAECCACGESRDVYGSEIEGVDYLKGHGILGKSLQEIR